MKMRKMLRVLHRDIGYFITGITLIYAFSGIILNHVNDFNPDYRVSYEEVALDIPSGKELCKADIIAAMKGLDRERGL